MKTAISKLKSEGTEQMLVDFNVPAKKGRKKKYILDDIELDLKIKTKNT